MINENPVHIRPRRILLVDDDKEVNEGVNKFLTTRGYVVMSAYDGQAGLKAFQGGFFDLVLSGLRLPEIDGMQLLKAIKSINPRVPIIIISGEGDVATVVDSLKHGAENFLTKPLQMDTLNKIIEQALTISYQKLGTSFLVCKAQQTTYIQCPSQPEAISEIVFFIAQSSVIINFAEYDLDNNIKLALVEAITNSMEHGNGWDETKMVSMQIDVSPQQLKVIISDCGEGFDHNSPPDPTDPENLLLERGRGIFLIKAIMDEVIYNSKGNEITIIKNK